MIRSWAQLVFVAGVALTAGSGCLFVGGDDGDTVVTSNDPYYTTIDRDHVLTTDLGEGAGLFVEYANAGVWTLWTSCDSNLTDHGCAWHAEVFADAALGTPEAFYLEGNDHIHTHEAGLSFYAETSYDMDMMVFTTEPGALVEIDVTLDGYLAPGYLVWFGNDVVHDGAPRSPVAFQPDAP